MKKITLIITLIFLVSFNILPQRYKYAWISGIQYELPPVKNDLKNIVNDINNKKEISFVVITGDLSKNSNNEELDSAKKLLDGLTVPYYLIPGIDDAKLNESCNIEFKDLWKDNKFAFNFKGVEHIGLNNGLFLHAGGHYKPEDLLWLDTIIAKIPPSEEVFFYSNYPSENSIDNFYQIINRFSGRKLKAIFFTFSSSNYSSETGSIPIINSPAGIDDNNGWKYTLVENTEDSVYLINVTNNGISAPIAGYLKNIAPVNKVDSLQFNNFTTEPAAGSTAIKAVILWQKDLRKTMLAHAALQGSNLFAVVNGGNIFCLNSTGSILWQNKCGETIVSTPAVTDSILIVGTVEGDLISFNPATGKIIQTLGLNEPITSPLITIDAEYNGAPAVGVVAGTSKGSLYCYDVNSFEMIWENHSAQGMIASEPLLVNDRIVFTSSDGYLYCIDAKTGVINWKLFLSSSRGISPELCSLVSDEKSVFAATNGKNVLSVDLLLGRTIWQKNNVDATGSLGISENNEDIFTNDYKGNILILSAKNGKTQKIIKTGAAADSDPSSILEWNKNIIFSSQNGTIYLIDKNYNCEPLLYLGGAGITNIINIKDNIFAASTVDGNITVFELK